MYEFIIFYSYLYLDCGILSLTKEDRLILNTLIFIVEFTTIIIINE